MVVSKAACARAAALAPATRRVAVRAAKVPGHIARMQAAQRKAASPDPRAAAARNARPSFNSAPSQASYTPPPRAASPPPARSPPPAAAAPRPTGGKVPGHIARMQAAAAKAASPDPRAAAARNARPSFNAAPSQASYTPPPRSTENEFA